MKPERTNQLIAEYCGWAKLDKTVRLNLGIKGYANAFWRSPQGTYEIDPPDFYNDLNAMHEAEMTLFETKDGWNEYARRLHYAMAQESIKAFIDFQKRDSIIGFAIHAGSAQRAEAFLKAIGTWEE